MPNTIALAKNYINYLDEAYRLASVTSDLTSDPTGWRECKRDRLSADQCKRTWRLRPK